MMVLILLVVVVLVLGGCACVVWAERGGPRWARGVAAVTLAVGDLVRSSESRRRRSVRQGRSSGQDGA